MIVTTRNVCLVIRMSLCRYFSVKGSSDCSITHKCVKKHIMRYFELIK